MIKFYPFVLLALSLLVLSCGKKSQEQALPPQPFPVYVVESRDVPIYNDFVGQVYGEKDIPIRARVEGFLTGIHFQEGEKVDKGQLLYTIDPEPFLEKVAAEKSGVSEAQTILVQTENDLKRIEPLAEMSAVSKQELDMARARRDAAESGLEAAQANLNIARINLGYTRLYAPISGIIGKTMAREGEFVGREPNHVILNTVSELENVRVQFFLSENDYLQLARAYITRGEKKKQGIEGEQRADLELILADGSLYDQKGKVDFIDRNIDASTGAILVQATFPNPNRLIRPGQFARVRARLDQEEDAIIVPQKCATELQGQFSVFVVNPENKLETRQIIVSEKIGDFYVVSEGLQVGDKVILEGIQKVRPEMEVIPQPTEFESQAFSKP